MPEADLWAAVFALAVKDACETEHFTHERSGNTTVPTARDAKEAWLFLTEGGEWAAHRDWLAGMNGVNAGIVREEAIRRGPSRATRAALMGEELQIKRPVVRRRARTPIERGQVAARNAALLVEYADGVPVTELSAKYDLLPATINMIASRSGVLRPDGMRAAIGRAVGIETGKAFAQRNAAIWQRSLSGEPRADIARDFGISLKAVESVLTRMRRAGSAVEDRGGARAAGGGEVSVSFHAQNMQENRT
jgi:hypothetical protein